MQKGSLFYYFFVGYHHRMKYDKSILATNFIDFIGTVKNDGMDGARVGCERCARQDDYFL